MLVDEFIKCVDRRDEMIKEVQKENLNNKEEIKEWKERELRPLDKQIIKLANRLLRQEYEANTTLCVRIKDVYNNQQLIEFYKDRKSEFDNSDEREF